jgi:hypothetical protein
MKKILPAFVIFISGCCIPLMGPCGSEEFIALGTDKNNAVIIHTTHEYTDDSEPGFGRTHLLEIFPEGRSPLKMSSPVSNVYLEPGKYRFSAFSIWRETPSRMGPVPVNCYRPLKAGNYLLQSVRRFKPDVSAWFYAVIQDAASTEIVCIASPGTEATPAPEWVKQMLKIK